MDRAVEADVDLLFPLLAPGVGEAIAQRHAGIVHDDIETAEIPGDAVDHLRYRIEIRNVGLIGDRLAASFLDLGNDAGGLLLRAAIIHGYGGAFCREAQRDLAADIPRRAGDE